MQTCCHVRFRSNETNSLRGLGSLSCPNSEQQTCVNSVAPVIENMGAISFSPKPAEVHGECTERLAHRVCMPNSLVNVSKFLCYAKAISVCVAA